MSLDTNAHARLGPAGHLRAGRARVALPGAGWIAAVAAALAPVAALLLTGPATVGYDTVYALLWGSELSHGQIPDFGAAVAPTPHPLANLAGALLAPLGATASLTAASLLVLASFAAMVWGAFALGRSLHSPAVGAVFALLIATVPQLMMGAGAASLDIPFLALVLLAAWRVADEPHRPLPVFALLGAAGLLRPEAWGLSALYAAWLFAAAPQRRRTAVVLAASAPVLWMAHDLLLAGNPLHSLTATQDLAAELERPRSLGVVPGAVTGYLISMLGFPVALAGAAGGMIVAATQSRRALLPVAVMSAGLLGFCVLGLADLPLLSRYLVLPAAMLCLLCAVALAAWTSAPSGRTRTLWAAAAIAVSAWAAVAVVPDRIDHYRGLDNYATEGRAMQADLRAVAEHPEVRAAAASGCQVVTVGYRVVPELSLLLGVRPSAIGADESARPALAVLPNDPYVAHRADLNLSEDALLVPAAPRDARPLAQTQRFNAYTTCSPTKTR